MPSRRALIASGSGFAIGASLGGGLAGGLSSCALPGSKAARDAMLEVKAAAELDQASQLKESFADLKDQRAGYQPITAAEKATRRKRLGKILAKHSVDALLVEPGATLDYLSNVSWHQSERLFALVVLADGSSFWVAPAFEVPRAKARIAAAGASEENSGENSKENSKENSGEKGNEDSKPAEAVLGWNEHEYPWEPLSAELRSRGVERIAIEPRCRAFVFTRLAAAFGAKRVLSGDAIVTQLRGRKDARELELLRVANELTQRAIIAVSERLEGGQSDHQIGAMMRTAQERLGLRNVWVLPLIGPDAALPHGSPTGRLLTKGDMILVDTGGSFHDYQSDNTRTWSFDGPAPEESVRGWHTVRDAQKRAFEAIRPGVVCGDIDRVARAVIEAAGYGEGYAAFSHRLGHGIGLEGHEEPYFDGGSEVVLETGMTFSDEPGIYLPGRFGIRIEDIVQVTDDGADHFGSWQKAPTSPA